MSENEQKTEQDKEKSSGSSINLTKDQATKIAIGVYYLIVACVIAIVIGTIWSIAYAIQPEGKWEAFIALNFGAKIAIVGAFIFLIFVLLVGAWVMFKRGNKVIYNALYPTVERKIITKDNRWAQVITMGFLISIFVLTFGLIYTILGALISGGTSSSWDVFTSVHEGLQIIWVSFIILVLVAMVLSFAWVWENGYFFVINKILEYNAPPDSTTYTKEQNYVAATFFIVLLASLITVAFGTIWAIMDGFAPTGKWDAFTGLDFGVKLLIIGSLFTLLFFLLISGLLFFQRGINYFQSLLFSKKVEIPKETDDDMTKMAKIISIGILVALIIILVGIVASLIDLALVLSGGISGSLFDFIGVLPGGLQTLFIGLFIIGLTWSIIGIIFLWQNGYSFVLDRLIKWQQKIDGEKEEA